MKNLTALFSAFCLALVLTLTGCSAGSITGPDLSTETTVQDNALKNGEGSTDPGNSDHNEGDKNGEGSTDPGNSDHNEG